MTFKYMLHILYMLLNAQPELIALIFDWQAALNSSRSFHHCCDRQLYPHFTPSCSFPRIL